MKQFLLIHYGEIGLKKANAEYFIEKLRKRIKLRFEKRFKETFVVKHTLRRIMVTMPDYFVESEYVEVLYKIFGIKNFKFVFAGSVDLEKLGDEIVNLLPKFDILPSNFRVVAKRSMVLPFKSSDAEREIGAIVLRSGFDVPVKMKGADFIIDIEFFNCIGFFSFNTYRGLGGLSGNSQGKLISTISSGIDSPVASWLMMRRGARVIFVHFHGYPYVDKDEMEQVEQLVEILSDYQQDTKLYLVPFGQFQKAIGTCLEIPSKIRTILYRRMMLRVSSLIARKEAANGIITGDCFGQVASQTPENLFVVDQASNIPVYRPLIGFDKEEIISLSEKIGAFEISKLPCKDSCTIFMPKKPELKANLTDTLNLEKNLDMAMWEKKLLADSEIKIF